MGWGASTDRIFDFISLFWEKMVGGSIDKMDLNDNLSFFSKYNSYFHESWAESVEYRHKRWYKKKYVRLARAFLGGFIVWFLLMYLNDSQSLFVSSHGDTFTVPYVSEKM
jgi:hypothetical protein